MQSRPLSESDIDQAYLLDKKWFGDHGISKTDLLTLVTSHQQATLALLNKNELLGFSTFEAIENQLPTDYKGTMFPKTKTLFIQQFTTITNYEIGNVDNDRLLLASIENKARELNCMEIWEALAINHPYKKENNKNFDAFGFYESQGYTFDKNLLTWEPNSTISIPCYVFRKLMP
jgi:hypothetical protein